jgi:uncharacterized protein YprB with RNaseH-like and TPR domain
LREPARQGLRESGAWIPAGFKTLRRTLSITLDRPMPVHLPGALPLLLPDLRGYDDVLKGNQFLFFDLETTGLSSGAGTVAFLAAFGRFVEQGEVAAGRSFPSGSAVYGELKIDQFLLLDYPGEVDFLEATLSFIAESSASIPGAPLFLTTYNGKSFDSQILKTRCLMNGFPPLNMPQADLLHPSRRLWRRMLPNCSQATIETNVLGLDRSGDLPGAMAPDIWFAFLKSGLQSITAGPDGEAAPEAEALGGICDHNVRDISGLASLFRGFANIAASPLEASRLYRCDTESLAMIWRRAKRFNFSKDFAHTAEQLLKLAAGEYPRARLRLGFDLFRNGKYAEGREMLFSLLEGEGPAMIQALALRSLSIDAERRIRKPETALIYAQRALQLEGLNSWTRDDLSRRIERLKSEPTGREGLLF